uniref:Uncharacterized protein n=1 Tax=Anguilla anguilla TaxID=7936 RepID=A0A0E9WPN8_ANGAN
MALLENKTCIIQKTFLTTTPAVIPKLSSTITQLKSDQTDPSSENKK